MKITSESRVEKSSPHGHDGLTIRQYYAGLAMQSLVALYERLSDKDNFLYDINGIIPQASVIYADKLIEELNKTEKE